MYVIDIYTPTAIINNKDADNNSEVNSSEVWHKK